MFVLVNTTVSGTKTAIVQKKLMDELLSKFDASIITSSNLMTKGRSSIETCHCMVLDFSAQETHWTYRVYNLKHPHLLVLFEL